MTINPYPGPAQGALSIAKRSERSPLADPAKSLERTVELCSAVYLTVRRRVGEAVAPLGLTFPQYGALAAAARLEGARQGDIARALHADRNTAMVLCLALEASGLVVRDPDPEDRRARRIVLTPKGRKAERTARRRVRALMREALEGLGDVRLAELVPGLAALASAVSQVRTLNISPGKTGRMHPARSARGGRIP